MLPEQKFAGPLNSECHMFTDAPAMILSLAAIRLPTFKYEQFSGAFSMATGEACLWARGSDQTENLRVAYDRT